MKNFKEKNVITENYEISKKIYYLFKKYDNYAYEQDKYNYDNLFKNRKYNRENACLQSLTVVEYKESIIKKIIRKIKNLFNFK